MQVLSIRLNLFKAIDIKFKEKSVYFLKKYQIKSYLI